MDCKSTHGTDICEGCKCCEGSEAFKRKRDGVCKFCKIATFLVGGEDSNSGVCNGIVFGGSGGGDEYMQERRHGTTICTGECVCHIMLEWVTILIHTQYSHNISLEVLGKARGSSSLL